MKFNRPVLIGVVCAAVIAAIGLATWARLAHHWSTDLTTATSRGESYLRERGEQMDPTMLLILDFLARRFDIEWMHAAASRVRTPAPAIPCAGDTASGADCEGPPARSSIRRLVDPSVRVTPAELADLANTFGNTMDSFTHLALHCRTVPLPADYPQRVEHWLDPAGGDYDPPHAALALQWAIEQDCLDATREAIGRLRARAIEELVRFADGVPRDQPIEAVAMLGYLGARDRVQREWIETIVAAQRENGGWGDRPDEPSNDHTTILALWVLLEQTRPARPGAWIPQSPSVDGAAAPS